MEAIKNGGQEGVKVIVDMKLDAMVLVKIKTSQNRFEQNGFKCYNIYLVQLPCNRHKMIEPKKDQPVKTPIETSSSVLMAAVAATSAESFPSVEVIATDPSSTTLIESSSCGSVLEFGSPSLVIDDEKNMVKSLNNSPSEG